MRLSFFICNMGVKALPWGGVGGGMKTPESHQKSPALWGPVTGLAALVR